MGKLMISSKKLLDKLHPLQKGKRKKKTKNIPYEIKKLIKEKRQARKKWLHSHSPTDETLLNQLTNRLKKKLKEAQNISICEYVTSLNRYDNTLWKPIKSTSKPLQANPPIR
jgi:hypothetical protein